MDKTPPDSRLPLRQVAAQARRVQAVLGKVRATMLAPEQRKRAPRFYTADVLALCHITKNQFDVAVRAARLPLGTIRPGNRREFTLQELQAWVRHWRADAQRPAGAPAAVVAVSNFKGGVTKTTTALTLAQGLSLRGHRVLAVDLDPQGSLTTLFGLLPDTEVDRTHTVLPLVSGEVATLAGAVRPTYWPGIDLVAAAPLLFGAEFALAERQAAEPGFRHWQVLEQGLAPLRQQYDVIVLDTPPALSFLTLNALWAATGLLMPVPPNALDFASSAQFWQLLADLTEDLPGAAQKVYDWVGVLPTRVEATDVAGAMVRQWLAAAYAERLLPLEIPKSAAAATASANFGTVYDQAAGSGRTVRRATDAFDRLADEVALNCLRAWRQQVPQEVVA